MTEHDESFDRRVREVLALAQDDAPEPGDRHTSPRRATSSLPLRMALVAAALILVVVAVAVLGGRSSDRAIPADSTSVTQGPPSTTVPFRPVNCGAGLATPYEEVGSIHTVVPNPLPLEVAIVAPDGGCTGGDGEVSITLINPTDLAVDVEPTSVILASGMEKWVVGRLAATTLQPGASVTSDVPIVVPPVAPGSYFVSLYGFDASAALTVAGPEVCTTTDLVSQVADSGVAGNDTNQTLTDVYQVARVTNSSDEPCVLLQPTWVSGGRFGEDSDPVGLLPGPGVQTVRPVPLADFVLEPGDSADLVLTTPRGCDSDRVVYDMIDVHLGVGSDPSGEHWVSVGQDVEVTCGLAVSDWLEPTPRT